MQSYGIGPRSMRHRHTPNESEPGRRESTAPRLAPFGGNRNSFFGLRQRLKLGLLNRRNLEYRTNETGALSDFSDFNALEKAIEKKS